MLTWSLEQLSSQMGPSAIGQQKVDCWICLAIGDELGNCLSWTEGSLP
jgi:hypothetical protein